MEPALSAGADLKKGQVARKKVLLIRQLHEFQDFQHAEISANTFQPENGLF
jgi:hypothetical protein